MSKLKNTMYDKTRKTVEKLIVEARESAVKVGAHTWKIPKIANAYVTFDPNKDGNIDTYIRKYYEGVFSMQFIEKVTLKIHE